MKRSAVFTLAGALILALAGGAQGAILYVDNHSVTPPANPWPVHSTTIQEAINLALPGDEIWVAKGIYDENLVLDAVHGNGVQLKGGYLGSGTTRGTLTRTGSIYSWMPYPTEITGGGRLMSVIRVAGCTDPSTRIDGFIIRNGVGTVDGNGCYNGGGIFLTGGSAPTISGNIFRQNGLSTGTTMNAGGAVYYGDSTRGLLTGNSFESNSAFYGAGFAHGGGVVLLRSSPKITRNVFVNNRAGDTGGAIMAHFNCNAQINNNLFVGNSSGEKGAAIAGHEQSTLYVRNNTFADNLASHGLTGSNPFEQGGVLDLSERSGGPVENNIFAFNRAAGVSVGVLTYPPPLMYNDFYGNAGTSHAGVPNGPGEISADPLFATALSGDYRLKHVPLSPCLDAGFLAAGDMGTEFDLDGRPRIIDGVPDMGCYESGSIPPYTTCTLSGTPGLNGWWVGFWTTATLNSTDAGSLLPPTIYWSKGLNPTWWNTCPQGFAVALTAQGTNRLNYYSKDQDGNIESPYRVTEVKMDSVRPLVSTIAPPAGPPTYTNVSPFTFAGTAQDWVSGVMSVEWKGAMGWSGSCTGTASWTASVPLAPGPNLVSIVAKDFAGNAATPIRQVYLDSIIPSLTVTSPLGTAVSTVAFAAFAGTATDRDSGLLSVRWRNSSSGLAGTCSGTTTWSASVPLVPGAQIVTFTATDRAGNSASRSKAAIFQAPAPDTTPPTVVSYPTGGPFSAPIQIVFSEFVVPGGIVPSSGISVVDPAAKKPVNLVTYKAISGNTLSLTATMRAGKTYLVTLPYQCVTDQVGNPFAGTTFDFAARRK